MLFLFRRDQVGLEKTSWEVKETATVQIAQNPSKRPLIDLKSWSMDNDSALTLEMLAIDEHERIDEGLQHLALLGHFNTSCRTFSSSYLPN